MGRQISFLNLTQLEVVLVNGLNKGPRLFPMTLCTLIIWDLDEGTPWLRVAMESKVHLVWLGYWHVEIVNEKQALPAKANKT